MECLNKFIDTRGKLVPVEFTSLPFEPQRIFYVTDVPINEWRGDHAHYSTKQILICLKGQILVRLETSKGEVSEMLLNKDESCFIDNMIWDSQKFIEEGSILLVLCSSSYIEGDYIKDKDLFLGNKLESCS